MMEAKEGRQRQKSCHDRQLRNIGQSVIRPINRNGANDRDSSSARYISTMIALDDDRA
jgi:hypothetical protein